MEMKDIEIDRRKNVYHERGNKSLRHSRTNSEGDIIDLIRKFSIPSSLASSSRSSVFSYVSTEASYSQLVGFISNSSNNSEFLELDQIKEKNKKLHADYIIPGVCKNIRKKSKVKMFFCCVCLIFRKIFFKKRIRVIPIYKKEYLK